MKKMKRTWSQAQDEEYGELGIIESVSLRNFMCHDNLSFDFDPHMNFIVGRNGSGKSAVLTGIMLALGGKSGATGRFSNIKGFIKTGKNSATVAVTLKNCGQDAYKPEEFGSKIIVERHITAEGSSSYKLKSEGGRIVSQSKEELTNILNLMDIQIDNPITVLTQEISRNFLLSKNCRGEKLFHLFYKGTGLEKVAEDYNRSALLKTDAKAELQNKKTVLPEMEKDLKKLKSLLDKSSRITELKKELLWSVVIDFEKKRDEATQALDRVERENADYKGKLQKFENDLNAVTQSASSVATDKQTTNSKMESIRKDLSELNLKRSALSSEIREAQGSVSHHERGIAKCSAEISSLETLMSDIRTKNDVDVNEDKLKHDEAVKNLKDLIMDTQAKIKELDDEKTIMLEEHAALNKKIEAVNAEINEIRYEKQNIEKDRKQLIDGKNNRISVFGPEMESVLREIQMAAKAGKFKIVPKGPIGMYINVKQSKWNFAVQECLKKTFLKTFLCDNHADSDRLNGIFNKYFQRNRPSIIITKFDPRVYDVTPHKTICDHPTVLDMLNVEDPVIINCLIDQCQIENVLLIADPSKALQLMLYNPPKKCKNAYTENGDMYCHTPFRNYSCRTRKQMCMLTTVKEDDIRKMNEELLTLDQNMAEKENHKEKLENHRRAKEHNNNEKDNEITQLKIKQNQLRMKLNDIVNNYREPRDINCLNTEFEQLQKQMQYHEDHLVSRKDVVASKNTDLSTLDKGIDELKRNLQVESRNFHTLSEQVDDCENKKEKLNSTIRKLKERLKDIEPILKDRKNEMCHAAATAEIATKNASNASPRIETKRSPDNIRQILKEMESFIERQKNCDRQALLAEYEEKHQTLSKAKAELERQEKINARIDAMLAVRLQEFKKICKNTSVSLTCTFTSLLQQNNFYGYPDVNFDRRTLEIIARPKKMNSKVTKKQNLAQLSGGERSYVTIAFLISLWDRIHMPFRILDEYDVFMDSNNRHRSIHLLINTAKQKTKVQYIFLSPLELPQIQNSDHVKIHKMPAPRK